MDWKEIEQDVVKIVPTLGGILGGPAGAAVGTLISSALGVPNNPESVQAALATDPNAQIKLAQIASDQAVQTAQIKADVVKTETTAEQEEIVAVNKTMQTSVHDGWRSACGWSIALASLAMTLGTLFLAYLALTGKDAAALNAIPALINAITIALVPAGASVGITSFHAGKADRGQ